MITQDQAYAIVEQFDIKDRYVFIFYPPNTSSAFLASYYYPTRNCCITTSPSQDSRSLSFELAHQLQFFYNENREGTPPIQIIDSNFPTDQLIIDKYNSVKPYASVLIKPNGEQNDMYELIEHPTKMGEVYALKNKVVRHISNRQTLLLGAKPLDQQWLFIDGQTVIRKVTQIEWNTFTVTDEAHYDPLD